MVVLPRSLAVSGAREMMDRLNLILGGRILDVATGPGDYIETLMKTLKDYDCFVGVDISEKSLESAEKRFEGRPVKLVKMNAESLKFDDDSFDTVCMAYSLHHLERTGKVLAEMSRVLKPGGNLIIQEEFWDEKQTEAQKTNLMQHAWMAQIDSLHGETHKTTLTKQEIKELVNNLSLEQVEMYESTHPVECLFCEKRFKCDDPKSEDLINESLKEIDENLSRLTKVAEPEARIRLEKMGEELKERNRKIGNTHPSVLLVIGKKGVKPNG